MCSLLLLAGRGHWSWRGMQRGGHEEKYQSQHYWRASRGPLRHSGHLVWSRPATLAWCWLTDAQWVHWVCTRGCWGWSWGQPCTASTVRQRNADIANSQPVALELVALKRPLRIAGRPAPVENKKRVFYWCLHCYLDLVLANREAQKGHAITLCGCLGNTQHTTRVDAQVSAQVGAAHKILRTQVFNFLEQTATKLNDGALDKVGRVVQSTGHLATAAATTGAGAAGSNSQLGSLGRPAAHGRRRQWRACEQRGRGFYDADASWWLKDSVLEAAFLATGQSVWRTWRRPAPGLERRRWRWQRRRLRLRVRSSAGQQRGRRRCPIRC